MRKISASGGGWKPRSGFLLLLSPYQLYEEKYFEKNELLIYFNLASPSSTLLLPSSLLTPSSALFCLPPMRPLLPPIRDARPALLLAPDSLLISSASLLFLLVLPPFLKTSPHPHFAPICLSAASAAAAFQDCCSARGRPAPAMEGFLDLRNSFFYTLVLGNREQRTVESLKQMLL